MADQLIIYMALAKGTSRMACAEPTLHARTAMVVAEKLLPSVRFRVVKPGREGVTVEGANDLATAAGTAEAECQQGLWHVECEGAGIRA